MEDPTLIRYAPPTKYLKEPLGAICKVLHDNSEYTYYVQISTDNEYAHWIKVGEFLEKAFIRYIKNPVFVSACLNLASCNQEERHVYIKEVTESLNAL